VILIDVVIPSNRNVIQKETERKLKYKNISIAIQLMWNMKCFTIPVVTGSTGIIVKGPKISANNIKKAFNRFTAKTAVPRTSHVIRKVLTS
jgi:hypothetical protein